MPRLFRQRGWFRMFVIEPIRLPVPGIEELRREAREEGYNFLETLVEEWASGANRFDGPGELLYGAIGDGLVVAVGGLNRDPFAGRDEVGRVRRVYVRPGWRNRGIGEALVNRLVEHARQSFREVRLRAENEHAARLYERLGFSRCDDPHATHSLAFDALSGGGRVVKA